MANSTNTTEIHAEVGSSILITYTAIVSMALFPIYIGSYLSLKRRHDETTAADERMTKQDAYMFPIIGSGVLVGLYVLFRFFSKEYVNMLLTAYFLFFGFFSLVETFSPVVKRLVPSLQQPPFKFTYRLPWRQTSTDLSFTPADVVAAAVSLVVLGWYLLSKHWMANNLLGLAFSIQGVSLIALPSYQVGCILLGGLFFYDIFWVFGTDVMVTVAKSFDAPIKLLFPKNLFAAQYQYSMLGLGDIVIPGVFVALLLRYDAHRAMLKSKSKDVPANFPKTYFIFTFIGYILGLVGTILVMHTFQAAQPALLYLVPACVGFSAFTGLYLGDFKNLMSFEETDSKVEGTGKKEDAKSK